MNNSISNINKNINGNYNRLRNLNTFGNITVAQDDYNIKINSNVIIYGNIDIQQFKTK